MNCADFEILLADYLDGTLAQAERASLDEHASQCEGCREFLRDAAGAMKFLAQAADVTPPPELVTRIAYHAPIGRTRQPFEKQGFFSRLAVKWLQPILRPRLAMGMAMTILSFSMLERCTGVRVQTIQGADLNPVRIWGGVEDKALRTRDRAVKYYENIRLVYDIETRLKDLEDQQEAASENPASARKRSTGQAAQTRKNGTANHAPSQGELKK